MLEQTFDYAPAGISKPDNVTYTTQPPEEKNSHLSGGGCCGGFLAGIFCCGCLECCC